MNNTKTVHLFDKDGWFTKPYEAQKQPRGEGHVIPTDHIVAKPAVKKNKWPKAVNGEWVYVDDYRGYVGYDAEGNEHRIDEREIAPNANWTTEPPMVRQQKALRSELMWLADSKGHAAKLFVRGDWVTEAQLERDRRKYARALKGKFTAEKNAIVIKKHEAYLAAIDAFSDLIEEFRETVADLIDAGELAKAKLAIKAAEDFGAETTREDVLNLLGGL